MPEMNHDGALLKITAYRWIAEQRKNIIPFTKPVGNGVIACAIVELMMVFIVRRRPCKSRKAVEKCYPIISDMVKYIRFPHRHMIVVMRNNRHRYCQVKRCEIQEHIKANAPLNK